MATRRACLATLALTAAGCATGAGLPAGIGQLPGARGETGPANRGRTANLGWVTGRQGVLVVDSGVSARHGAALHGAITRTTPLPLAALVLTHTRQEFVFGTSSLGAPVWMHTHAARLMAARCDRCLTNLRTVLGEAEMQGSVLARPAHLFADPADVPAVDRPGLALLSFGHSASPGAAVVWDGQTRTLFAGALLDNQVIPDVQDADLAGWRTAWRAMAELAPQHIIPGHGPAVHGQAACQALIATNARYLAQLEARTAALLQAGAPLSEVADRTALPEFAGWDQYDTIHRRNASIVFLKHERALLQGGSP
ncbi:MAG: MBL fold metallo-hydrolase [Proteobacteria bacterium]|nr:MBL fold metallo-hydrolase [Pseudomonadota bacterium]